MSVAVPGELSSRLRTRTSNSFTNRTRTNSRKSAHAAQHRYLRCKLAIQGWVLPPSLGRSARAAARSHTCTVSALRPLLGTHARARAGAAKNPGPTRPDRCSRTRADRTPPACPRRSSATARNYRTLPDRAADAVLLLEYRCACKIYAPLLQCRPSRRCRPASSSMVRKRLSSPGSPSARSKQCSSSR